MINFSNKGWLKNDVPVSPDQKRIETSLLYPMLIFVFSDDVDESKTGELAQ